MSSKPKDTDRETPAATPPARGAERNVGDALRAVYQDAVSETVPDEMLDLLKQLG